VVEKPPGTQEQLTEKARNWVKAIGGDGKFPGSPECGCVKPKIELSMSSEWKGTDGSQTVTAEVKATVKLTADSSGLVYTGQAPLQHGRYTAPTAGCRVVMKPVGGVLDVKEARFDIADDKRMTISLAVEPTNSGGTMTYYCPKMGPVTVPVMPWRGSGSSCISRISSGTITTSTSSTPPRERPSEGSARWSAARRSLARQSGTGLSSPPRRHSSSGR